MTELQRIYNMNPRRLGEIISQVMEEINKEDKDLILREKVCLIEDIFKCGKCLAGFSPRYNDYLAPTPFMFDCLYDKTLDELALVWAELKAQLRQHALRASDGICNI